MAPQSSNDAPHAAFPPSLEPHAFIYDKVLSTSRKLRKSCSLPNCSQRPGECMHCTCDGRCGQHEGGKCGVRREGSGKSCKRLGCPKDETCLHSTRATCCHCRNLVSSQSRSMKAKRAMDESEVSSEGTSLSAETVAPAVASGPASAMSTAQNAHALAAAPLADKAMKLLAQDKKRKRESLTAVPAAPAESPKVVKAKKAKTVTAPTKTSVSTPSLGAPSLCEYPEWSRRRNTCNLIVVVEGTQFNLHKFPMLIACPELRTKMPTTDDGSIAVLKYAHFPGGAAAFELACIYAYTGSLDVNATNVALLYCAARILKMHVKLTSKCANLLESLAQSGSGTDVVHMLLQVVEIRKCLRNQSTDRMMALCVNAIAQRYPYEASTMQLIVKLPCDVFLHITQLVLNDKPNTAVSNVVARLCAQAHLAQVFRSVQPAQEKAAELVKVLDILLHMDPEQSAIKDVSMEEEEGEVVEDAEVKVEAKIASALGVAPTFSVAQAASYMLTA